MPRSTNGTYTLPSGNPVIGGTYITTAWGNPTMADIASALTDSLSRSGQGGMLVPFKNADGNVITPGVSWTNESNTGFYRAAAADMRVSVAGSDRMRWNAVGSQLWDGTNWANVLTSLTLAPLLTPYAIKAANESITGVWTFAPTASEFSPIFDDYARFANGAQCDHYLEMSVPLGSVLGDGAAIYFWDYNAVLNEKGWKFEYDRSQKNLVIASVDDASAGRNLLEFQRGVGQAVTNINYGNSTDNPLHTFFGVVTQAGIPFALQNIVIDTADSLFGGGDLSASRTLSLDGDVAAPGSSWYYGTDAGGIKGWFPLSGVVGVPEAPIDGNIYGRQNASWANLGGAGLYVLKAGDTMTGALVLNYASPKITQVNSAAAVDNQIWDILVSGVGINFRTVNDAQSVARNYLAAARSGVTITSLALGNATDLPPTRIYSTLASLGVNTYQVVAASAYAAGVGGGNAGRAEIGVSMSGGTANPRACLFSNQTDSTLGLDWVFSSGVVKFSFRRVGTEIFSYTSTGVTIPGGLSLTLFDSTNAVNVALAMTPIGATLKASSVSGSIDLMAGVNLCFRAANAGNSSYRNLTILGGLALTLNNAANTVSKSLDLGTADEIVVDTRGGLWHWNATNLPRGNITLATVTPAATGNPGDIVLVYE
jgi:hypothetical protein